MSSAASFGWALWFPLTAALVYFAGSQKRLANEAALTACIIAMVLLYYFLLPKQTGGATALYGAFVLMVVTAAFNARSRFYEIASLILASLYATYNATDWLISREVAVQIVPFTNGFAAFYFLYMAQRPGAQHRELHYLLAILQFAALGFRYVHLLAGVIPNMSEVTAYWWYALAVNRMFDAQLLLMLVASRLRPYVRRKKNAGRPGDRARASREGLRRKMAATH